MQGGHGQLHPGGVDGGVCGGAGVTGGCPGGGVGPGGTCGPFPLQSGHHGAQVLYFQKLSSKFIKNIKNHT